MEALTDTWWKRLTVVTMTAASLKSRGLQRRRHVNLVRRRHMDPMFLKWPIWVLIEKQFLWYPSSQSFFRHWCRFWNLSHAVSLDRHLIFRKKFGFYRVYRSEKIKSREGRLENTKSRRTYLKTHRAVERSDGLFENSNRCNERDMLESIRSHTLPRPSSFHKHH